MKCSDRRELPQTSHTSCLRVSLRQGNSSGAKGPVCVCAVKVWVKTRSGALLVRGRKVCSPAHALGY